MYITCGMFWPHDSAHWCNNKTTLALNNWHLQDIWADSVPVMQGMFIQQGPSVCVNRSGRSQPSCWEWLLVRELAKKHCSAVRTMAGTMLVFFFVLQEAESLSQSLPVNVNFTITSSKHLRKKRAIQWHNGCSITTCLLVENHWYPLSVLFARYVCVWLHFLSENSIQDDEKMMKRCLFGTVEEFEWF